MAKKQTGDRVANIAARVLNGEPITKAELRALAASALSQDETKGPRKKRNPAKLTW